MDLISIAIALKKAFKYTDDKIASAASGTVTDVTVEGTSVVTDGVAEIGSIASEDGVSGLRYYNGVLQYKEDGAWVTIPLSSQTI